MAITYFKRFQMQFDLRSGIPEVPELKSNFYLVPWESEVLECHADAKYLSFREELDANVFPCLGDADGCLRLMKEISCRQGFIPEATWLVIYKNPDTDLHEYLGSSRSFREDPYQDFCR